MDKYDWILSSKAKDLGGSLSSYKESLDKPFEEIREEAWKEVSSRRK